MFTRVLPIWHFVWHCSEVFASNSVATLLPVFTERLLSYGWFYLSGKRVYGRPLILQTR